MTPRVTGWYLHRLRAMSLPEIWYRLRQQAIVGLEKYKVLPTVGLVTHRAKLSELWARFRDERDVHFFFRQNERDTIVQFYQERFASEQDATLRLASDLLQHKLCIFGYEFNLGSQIGWHRDPLTGREWPSVYWADIDIRDGQTVGGVKWVWELNRHHHLVTLGKAYFLSGDERYAQVVCAQLADWVQNNPPYIGINWTSPLELAIRLINWTWALAFVRRSAALTLDLFEAVLQSMAVQAGYVSRHLSAYSSANNHLIGEAAGLAVVGLCFLWLPRAECWRQTGLSILAREVERQIYPDGVPAEQAMAYLGFVLDCNLLAWRLAELNGLDVPQVWYKRLEAACNFICAVMDEGGHVPAIGDSDDAWVVRLDDRPTASNFHSILATAAAMLKRPDFKARAGRWDEKSYWLLGHLGLAAYEALPAHAPPIASQVFKAGGYCVMRAPGRVLTFDCGPLGYLSTAVHGHADALSLMVSVEGQPILVDSGTYVYQEGSAWRDFFRSTAAHNTVVVDGQDQSEMQGTFLWGRKAQASLLQWESGAEYDLAIAEHDGYARLGVIHRRTILFVKPDWCLVVDQLNGQGNHHLEQTWHLPTAACVQINTDGVELIIGDIRAMIAPVDIPEAEVAVRLGEESPMQGWVSPHYGQRRPAPVLSFSGRVDLPVRWVTALCFVTSRAVLSARREKALGLLNKLERKE